MIEIVVGAVLVLVIGLGFSALAHFGPVAEVPLPEEVTLTQIGAEETLWDVAHRVAPEHNPAHVIARIRQINDGTVQGLRAGQLLWVPDTSE